MEHWLTHVLAPNLNKHFRSTSDENIGKKRVPADVLYWSVVGRVSLQGFRGEVSCAEVDLAFFCSDDELVF